MDSRGAIRDSAEVNAIVAHFFAQKLLAVTTNPSKAIAIDQIPLARVKRIMKQDSCDPHPRMISAEAVPLMAYAVQLFIGCLTKLAWSISTQPSRRNTLQLKDLKAAVHASSKFDFLLDVIDTFERDHPQQEVKRSRNNDLLKEPTPVPGYLQPQQVPTTQTQP